MNTPPQSRVKLLQHPKALVEHIVEWIEHGESQED